MRDYDSTVKNLREAAKGLLFDAMPYRASVMRDAADAIEELLAAEPPLLWTDEPIEGTEFMTHSQGGEKGFEIHFRTDSLEKYKAVQDECRRQIGHAKPEPPKGGNHDN